MAKKLTYEEYLSPNYRPIMQQGQQDIAAKFKATMERNAKIANSPLEDRDGVDVDLDIVPTATPNAGNVSAGTNVLGNESATDAVKSLYVQPNLIQAKGYTEWLEAGGMAGAAQRQYDATVRAAETDYAKSKALYGQNAETLGRAGLTGSGYGDYLTGAGFAAMQGAKVAAADTRALTEAQQRSDYANYLMGVDQANREAQAAADAQNRQTYAEYLSREGGAKEAIDAAMAQGLDDTAIRAYVQQRYGNEFDSYLDGWIANAHTYNDPIMAQQQAQQTEAETEQANAAALARRQQVNALYAELLSGGAVPEAARQQMLANGYTEAEIAEAAQLYTGTNAAQQNAALNIEGLSMADIPTIQDINNRVIAGQLSEEQGEEIKALAQQKRIKLLDEQYDNLSNEDALGFISQVHELYKSGNISRENFAKYASGLVAENVASIADDKTVKEPAVEIANIINSIQDNEDVYGDVEDEIIQTIADSIAFSSHTGMDIFTSPKNTVKEGVNKAIENYAKDVGAYAAGAAFGQVGSGIVQAASAVSDYITKPFDISVGENTETIDFRLGLPISDKKFADGKYENKPVDTIVYHDGSLYCKTNLNTWRKMKNVAKSSVGNKENANAIYELILTKYKNQ